MKNFTPMIFYIVMSSIDKDDLSQTNLLVNGAPSSNLAL